MEYGYRPENPAPEGTRDAAPSTKVAGLDAQNLKDKFTGNNSLMCILLKMERIIIRLTLF